VGCLKREIEGTKGGKEGIDREGKGLFLNANEEDADPNNFTRRP
jgi:hypothetical protein